MKNYFQKGIIEAGCDEAGRGCLAGPVFAAAVILPEKTIHPLLNDSKQLSEQQRDFLRPIIETKALAFAVAMIDHEEIDCINILKASIKAMHLAVEKLSIRPELLLIDGNRFTPFLGISHQTIVGGDGKFASIAAASILAKTYRDDYMNQLHDLHPEYDWKQNKGYGTLQHRQKIKQYGLSPFHRKTFKVNLNFKEE